MLTAKSVLTLFSCLTICQLAMGKVPGVQQSTEKTPTKEKKHSDKTVEMAVFPIANDNDVLLSAGYSYTTLKSSGNYTYSTETVSSSGKSEQTMVPMTVQYGVSKNIAMVTLNPII